MTASHPETNRSRRLRVLHVAAVAGALILLATAAPALGAKKKNRGTVDITEVANLPIPDKASGAISAPDGSATSTIEVGKQFKGRRVRDVNVTVQTTGTANKTLPGLTGPFEAIDLTAILRAPSGAHVTLFQVEETFPPIVTTTPLTLSPFPSLGPLTLDDEARLDMGNFNPVDPYRLYAPYAGAARPTVKSMANLDGGPVRGTWTLTILDQISTGTSNLTSWRLQVAAGKPFLTK
jgi:hypothetical protein